MIQNKALFYKYSFMLLKIQLTDSLDDFWRLRRITCHCCSNWLF